MSERAEGFYWVRVISGPPRLRAEVAEWRSNNWWMTGEEYSIRDNTVRVLAGPLPAPENRDA